MFQIITNHVRRNVVSRQMKLGSFSSTSTLRSRSSLLSPASTSTSTSTSTFESATTKRHLSSKIRRRRRKTGSATTTTGDNNNKNDEHDESQSQEKNKKNKFQIKDMIESTATGLFIPRNQQGEEITMGEYLEFATLSPWVPCPDAVARRALDIAGASSKDVHYELGSGDGRVNFFAVDLYHVQKSVGIDIDTSLVIQSNQRIMKRHPAPTNIQFISADLLEEEEDSDLDIWNQIADECTILTMYFVDDALSKIKPLLEKHLLGKQCKVITIGYQVQGWEPKWSEVALGLTINMYEMHNLDELFNQSTAFAGGGDTSTANDDDDDDNVNYTDGDIELNERSRQILLQQNKDESSTKSSNPFADQVKKATYFPEEDYDMDFDEHELFDDDATTRSMLPSRPKK